MAVEERKTALLGNLMAGVIRKAVPGKLFPETCWARGGWQGREVLYQGPASLFDDWIPVWLQKALGLLWNTQIVPGGPAQP